MIKKTEPLVTVITITFNLIKAGREKYFRQCLESVHNQTYKNIEHIVVDGASKDGTVDLIKEYADKGRIRYVSEPDKGIYDAMNKGVMMARGKYAAFLNSDDYYNDADGIEKTVALLEKLGADFSYAPAIILREDGNALGYAHPQSMPNISNAFLGMPFCHQTMFTRRDLMIKEGMFDTNFKSAGDFDFVMRLCLKKSKSVFVNLPFVTYRLGGLSDFNRAQSLKEIANAYRNNLGRLVHLTEKDCGNIYGYDPGKITPELAKILKEFKPYFNYDEYLESVKPKNRIMAKLKYLFSGWGAKFCFAIFSPNKFIRKYFSIFMNTRLMSLIRKIYYPDRPSRS